MSSLPQLMLTALEDTPFASLFIFRFIFSLCTVVTFKELHRRDTPDKKTCLSTQLIGCFGEL